MTSTMTSSGKLRDEPNDNDDDDELGEEELWIGLEGEEEVGDVMGLFAMGVLLLLLLEEVLEVAV